MITPLPGVFNQVTWPGVGDVDDCQVITSFWALVAAGIVQRRDLPSVERFRAAAGRPDRPGDTGITNAQALTAIRTLYPQARAYSYVGAYTGFLSRLAQGAVASLSVKSAELPPAYRFGFTGNHQVGIVVPNYLMRFMNPLDGAGDPIMAISENSLRAAAESLFGDGRWHANIIPPLPDTRDAEIAALSARIEKAKVALG